jgi:hypothetical protein
MSGKKSKANRRDVGNVGIDWSAVDVQMISDDLAWLYSSAQSVSGTPWEGVSGLVHGIQMARVAYEGFTYLAQKRPAEASSVERANFTSVAAARHSIKLIDDTAKHSEGVLEDFRLLQDEHESVGAGEDNFSAAIRDGRLFSTSRLISFQGLADFKESQTPVEQSWSAEISTDMGRLMADVVLRLGRRIDTPVALPAPVGPSPIALEMDYAEFHASRFEPEFSNAQKDLLSAVESGVNGALWVFDSAQERFPAPVFRAQFVNLSHGLSALGSIAQTFDELSGREGMRALTATLETPAATRLRSLGALRNRSMHYGLPRHLTGLNRRLPIYGIVEAVTPYSYDDVRSDLYETLGSVSDLLRDWAQPQFR